MNRVYRVSYKGEGTYYTVGAESRNQALSSYITETSGDGWEYINYRASLARDYNGKTISTEKYGNVDMDELMSKGYMTWWECAECGADGNKAPAFDYIPIDKYKCKKCGYVGEIPFSE